MDTIESNWTARGAARSLAGMSALLVLVGGLQHGCGGGSSTLEFKGLRLGMPVEEAARVMVGHGFAIGGEADPGYETWAHKEHMAAQRAHAVEEVRRLCEAKGFVSMRQYFMMAAEQLGVTGEEFSSQAEDFLTEQELEEYLEARRAHTLTEVRRVLAEQGGNRLADYLRHVTPPEEFAPNEAYIERMTEYRMDVTTEVALVHAVEVWEENGWRETGISLLPGGGFPDPLVYLDQHHPEILAVENLDALVQGRLGNVALPAGAEPYPDLDAYIAEHYPDGRPYHLGGPWDGKAALVLEEDERLEGESWTIWADPAGNVAKIELIPGAVNMLFNAGDLSGEEFAESFADAYGIPGLEFQATALDPDLMAIFGRAFSTGWAYADRDNGWSVTIAENKRLIVSAITPAAETTFD